MLPFKFFHTVDAVPPPNQDDYPGWVWTDTDVITRRVLRNDQVVDMNYIADTYYSVGIINFLRLFHPTDEVYMYSMECNGIKIYHDDDNQGWPWDVTRESITFEAIIIPRERFL